MDLLPRLRLALLAVVAAVAISASSPAFAQGTAAGDLAVYGQAEAPLVGGSMPVSDPDGAEDDPSGPGLSFVQPAFCGAEPLLPCTGRHRQARLPRFLIPFETGPPAP